MVYEQAAPVGDGARNVLWCMVLSTQDTTAPVTEGTEESHHEKRVWERPPFAGGRVSLTKVSSREICSLLRTAPPLMRETGPHLPGKLDTVLFLAVL